MATLYIMRTGTASDKRALSTCVDIGISLFLFMYCDK